MSSHHPVPFSIPVSPPFGNYDIVPAEQLYLDVSSSRLPQSLLSCHHCRQRLQRLMDAYR